MKAKSILVAALVIVSSATFANEGNNNFAVIRGKESGIFKVIFEGEEKIKATVNILDQEGNLVFTTNVEGKNGFILPVNFTGLKAGVYSVEVKNGSNTFTQTINYERASYVKVAKEVKSSSIQHVHVAKLQNDGKYLLSIAKKGSDVVTINIFDVNNELLHTETRKADGDIAVVYEVKNSSVKPTFQVTDKAGYSKVIKK